MVAVMETVYSRDSHSKIKIASSEHVRLVGNTGKPQLEYKQAKVTCTLWIIFIFVFN